MISAGASFGLWDDPVFPRAMDLLQSSCLAAISKAHVAQQVEHFLGKEEVHRFDPGRGLHPALIRAVEDAGKVSGPWKT